MGSISIPAFFATSGAVILRWMLLVFHSNPSGCRILRSYCSIVLKGWGTSCRRYLAAYSSSSVNWKSRVQSCLPTFLSLFSLMITSFKLASFRVFSGFFSCGFDFLLFFLWTTPSPVQDPYDFKAKGDNENCKSLQPHPTR